MHPTEELPSLRATLRLGVSQLSHKLLLATLYDVKFYPYNPPGVDPVFAICGGPCVWICRPVYSKDTSIEILRVFQDEDVQNLNSLAWSRDFHTGDPLVLASSERPKINVLNVTTGQLVRTIIGHGAAINDLAISPQSPYVLASASNDHTVRIWNLDPALEKFSCAAICAGEGHTDGILACAWHRSGRYLLSGGHDAIVNMWVIPDIPDENSGTDHVTTIHYPHFTTNEVHSDYVDCLQFFGDLILSRSAKESKIYLWRIRNFSPDLYTTHASIPSPTAPEIGHSSFTRSAFGSGFERLLTFETPYADLFYMRFSLFHMPHKRPILCAGNERSKVFFWDIQRLEEGPPEASETGRWAGHRKKTMLQGEFDYLDDDTNASTTDANAAESVETTVGKGKDVDPEKKYGVDDPFRELQAHKFQVVPKVTFCVRQVAWSPGGEWCVVCGDNGMVAVFSRWMN
ncbi:WD40 repeat-like protein [Rhizodiscina lignyota]|uniref:WD40 repeat-like protein n=1 Tax=Rhizodiscina lignyota TaxID=1504668 RepID=A0A9P4I6Z5_9PEZI|nr:WD40 repeat-like protein [Rhizodiscina lignyota]